MEYNSVRTEEGIEEKYWPNEAGVVGMTDKEKRKVLLELDRAHEMPPAVVHQIMKHGPETFDVIVEAIEGRGLNPRQVICGFAILSRYGSFRIEWRRKLLDLLLEHALSEDEAIRTMASVMAAGLCYRPSLMSGWQIENYIPAIVDRVRKAYSMGIIGPNREYIEHFLRKADQGLL